MVLLAALAARSILHKISRVWAYVLLGSSGIILEEAAPVVAGFEAHQGNLGLVRAGIACTVGIWAAGMALYYLGRWRGDQVMARWPRLRPTVERLTAAVRRRPWYASIAVRYAYGARLLLPLTCGAAQLPLSLFAIGSGISAISWTALFLGLGWGFGHSAVLVLGRIRRYENTIAIALAVSVAIVAIIVQLRNRRRVAEEIAGIPEPASGASAER